MGLADVVPCAGGVTVLGRGVPEPDVRSTGRTLRIGPVGPIDLPTDPPVVAQRADGSTWRLHWISAGRLVVDIVDLARIAVDPDGTVTVDRELDEELEEHLVFDHVLPLVLAGDGHLVLHGGITSLDGRGVALVGSSGAGKSTLVGHAWRHGWTVGNDDGVVLTAETADGPWAEPTYATLRLTPSGAELVGIDPADTSPVVGKLRVDDRLGAPFRQAPVRLHVVAIVEPAASGAEARFERLTGMDAHAELFGSTFHADFARDRRLPQVLATLADVVEGAVIGRVFVPRGRAGLEGAERVLRSLVTEPVPR